LEAALKKAGLKLKAPVLKAIIAGIGERDDAAEICRDSDGNPEPDTELNDTENVPLKENIETYFAREVTPHVPDAWIDPTYCDAKDGEVGRVGYEIPFNRHFYVFQPPRPLSAIDADLKASTDRILKMIGGLTQ
jgi:type I restriction enzyme M protein